MSIKLKDIWPIENALDYKVHFARVNKDGRQPLDDWLEDNFNWFRWQEYRPQRNDFNREFIFSFNEVLQRGGCLAIRRYLSRRG